MKGQTSRRTDGFGPGLSIITIKIPAAKGIIWTSWSENQVIFFEHYVRKTLPQGVSCMSGNIVINIYLIVLYQDF